jgi:aspartate aminotransferase
LRRILTGGAWGNVMKLAQRIMALEESATLAVAAKAAKLKAAGVDVISFGTGEPDFDTPANVKEAAARALAAGQTKYAKPSSGIPQLKQAVCGKFQRENNLAYTPDQVIVDAGGKMICYLAVQALIDPGDEVIIPVPYWVSYPEMVKLAGGKCVFLVGDERNDFKITPQQLAAAITPRTRAFIFNSPSNPGGFAYTAEETQALAKVTAGKDLTVLADEIYDRLIFGGQKYQSYGACSPAAFAQTLTINAGSKTYSMTGWRIGYAAGPKLLVDAMIKLQSQTTSGACTFVQHGLLEALNASQDEVETMRAAFEERGKRIHALLSAIPGIRCPKPTGAFYAFPNVSGTFKRLGVKDSLGFAEMALEKARIAVVPGAPFGSDEHVRMSFACSMQDIETGVGRLAQMLA